MSFTSKGAATAFVEGYRKSTARSLGRLVEMEVHDVGQPGATLEPGQVFTIEPAMAIPSRSALPTKTMATGLVAGAKVLKTKAAPAHLREAEPAT
jgi:hypothetical protein